MLFFGTSCSQTDTKRKYLTFLDVDRRTTVSIRPVKKAKLELRIKLMNALHILTFTHMLNRLAHSLFGQFTQWLKAQK